MTDETPRSGISDLSKPGEAEAIMKRAFPRDTVETVHAITEVPVRSITRWMKDEQRMPPTLKAKFQDQAIRKRAFLDDIDAILRQHEAAGLLPEVMRQALLVHVNEEFFKKSQTL